MPPTEIRGSLDGSGLRIGIAAARFNEYVTDRLLDGALRRLDELGVAGEHILVVRVPGSFELGAAAMRLASPEGNDMDSVICLGAVIQGDTAHFEHVAQGAAAGVASAQAQTGKPVIFGVLTTYTTDQAVQRASSDGQNLGAEYAEAAVEMANLQRALADL